jgi:hypothetical protein
MSNNTRKCRANRLLVTGIGLQRTGPPISFLEPENILAKECIPKSLAATQREDAKETRQSVVTIAASTILYRFIVPNVTMQQEQLYIQAWKKIVYVKL